MNWMIELAAENPWSLGSFLAGAGPLAAACALLTLLTRMWFENRTSRRDDKKADVEGVGGIVDAASDAVKLVREQLHEMKEEIREQKAEISTLRALRESDAENIDKLNNRVRELESENEWLRRQGGTTRPVD